MRLPPATEQPGYPAAQITFDDAAALFREWLGVLDLYAEGLLAIGVSGASVGTVG